MVTGDLNAALVEWVVQYRISDPGQVPVQGARARRHAARRLRDRDARGRRRPHRRRGDHHRPPGDRDRGAAKLQALATKYEMGISIDQVQLKNVNPPEKVQASFNEVNQAQQEKEKLINDATARYNKVIPRAEGEKDQSIREAEATAEAHQRGRGRRRAVQRAARRVPQGAGGHPPAHLPRDHGGGAAERERQGDRRRAGARHPAAAEPRRADRAAQP